MRWAWALRDDRAVAGGRGSRDSRLPPGFETTCLVTLGYPADAARPASRKELKHVVEYR